MRTGDIALYRGNGLFPWLIRTWTRSDINHVALLVRKRDGGLYKRHAAKGWLFHRSFVEEPFSLSETSAHYVVRVNGDHMGLKTVARRSADLLGKTTPYDWRAILGIALGPVGKYLGHSQRRFMCSEAVSWCWRQFPESKVSIFIDKPHDDVTPADILNSAMTTTIWRREPEPEPVSLDGKGGEF
jgi:hypothetical protein